MRQGTSAWRVLAALVAGFVLAVFILLLVANIVTEPGATPNDGVWAVLTVALPCTCVTVYWYLDRLADRVRLQRRVVDAAAAEVEDAGLQANGAAGNA